MTRRLRILLRVLIPLFVVGIAAYFIELPYYTEGPGPARDVFPLIDVEGTTTYQPDGRLLLTTISVDRANVFDMLWAGLHPVVRVVPETAVIPPGITDEEYDEITRSQMDGSKVAAAAVALGELEDLTDYPEEHRPGALVQAVVPGSPAAGNLFAGDLITEVDGEPLEDVEAFARAVEEAGTEKELVLKVRPVEAEGNTRDVRITPEVLPDEDRPLVGVVLVDNFPFPVVISSADIGGPSAGLMWTLGLYDVLSPGDLTGGRTLAGTGTIELTGNVGPIGGVGFKVLAAEEAGAEVFFVPAENLAEARSADAGIELVPVRTVNDALEYLDEAA